jgi:ribosome-binding factor A
MDSLRQNKVSRLIQKELALFFQTESRTYFQGKMITVTQVRISPDLSLAKVYISIFPLKEKEDFLPVVTQHTKIIRNGLSHKIRHQVRIIPELVFYRDDSIDYADRIEKLLKS